MLRQFLLDAPEIFLRVGVVHPAAIGEGDPAHRLCLLGHLLLAQVVAVEIPLVVARERGAAEAVAVMLGVHDIAIAPAILGKLTPVPVAVASHRSQILERPICPKRIHDFLKFTLEFLGVELVIVVGPPGVVESFSGRSEIYPDMADRAQPLVGGLIEFRIEEARFLGRSGPDVNRCIYFYILLHGICLRIRTEMVNLPVRMSHPTQSYSLECDGDVIIVVISMIEIRCVDDIFLNICGKSFIKAGEICPKSLVKIFFDVTLQLFR